MDLTLIISLLASIVFAAVSVALWRKATGYHHLLQEAANRFEEGRKLNSELQKKSVDLKQELDELRLTTRRLEHTNTELRGKNNQFATELKKIAARPEVDEAAYQNRIEDLQAQVAALTSQLKNSDSELAEERRQHSALKNTFSSKTANEVKELENQVHSLKSKADRFDELEGRFERLAKHATKLAKTEQEFKQSKKKLANLQHMLKSMRGLKEMAEERLENYEIALRILSSHTLGQKSHENEDKAIGPIVGAALESIGHEIMPEDADVTSFSGDSRAP